MILYRLLLGLFALGVLLRHPGKAQVMARLGYSNVTTNKRHPAAGKPHVWLHGASNGELASARPVLDALMSRYPDMAWLITANTETGVEMVRGWNLPGIEARLAPLDLRCATRRVMRRWNIVAHISLEAEIWPNRFQSCPGPVVLLAARMSAGTARGWARLPGLSRDTLARVTKAYPQDPKSGARLEALGLPQDRRAEVVDLKALYRAPSFDGADPEPAQGFARDKTWLAASTHEGEEEIVLDAHLLALAQQPELRLVLAPRHPRRADDIEALATQRGLSLARRSRAEPPGTAQVYLADTMGEMPLWYHLCGRVFIAGSLTDRGGHTPYEPAAFGCALIHGPDVANHRAGYARLKAAQAAVEIEDAPSLARALAALQSAQAQSDAGQAARDALKSDLDAHALAKSLSDDLFPA